MISISKPLNAASVSAYFRSEYGAANSHYYAENKDLHGEFHGKIAEVFGLTGQQVKAEQFDRLALGQDPNTGEQLIRHRNTALTAEGKEVPHRAGYDLTFSAPKSVSLTALVGGDGRIVEAHRAAVRESLGEAERLIQARGGGNRPPITTGKFIVATFDHDTSRPVDGYAAAQLHTHAVLFNMTEDANGQARSLQSHEIYVTAKMLTAIYQNSMERALREMGYTLERGKNHAVEISGYTPEYLASESQRSKEIEKALEEKGLVGAAAASYAAHSTRGEKLNQTSEEVKAAHLQNAEKHGNQPQRVVAEAAHRVQETVEMTSSAYAAVRFARLKLSEREAVFDHHQVVTEALRYSRGRIRLRDIQHEIRRQVDDGVFIPVSHVRPNAPLWRYTTPELIADERVVLEAVRFGSMLNGPVARYSDESLEVRYPHLNEWQRRIIRESLGSERQITGIQGSAGTGKTTSLRAIRELAEESGWKSVGLAPTSGAARALKEAGITESETLQRFLIRDAAGSGTNRLFFLDESSLTAARQMRKFVEGLTSRDRVIIVGDRRQHDSVEAGRIFEELQLGGMETARINKLVRQKDPGLREVVKAFAQDRIPDGVKLLDDQGRVTAVSSRNERFKAIAKSYAESPEGTLVLSPDNHSRMQLNSAIRTELRAQAKLGEFDRSGRILVNKQNITSEDRVLAEAYEIGDVVRYRKPSHALKVTTGEYGAVIASDREANLIKIKLDSGKVISYNPAKFRGVSIYAPELRNFTVGDRLQFTAPSRKLGVSNRDAGTITEMDTAGNVRVKLDDGRSVGFNLASNRHIDHGYVSTSHASQGATVDRVLVHIDTGDTRITNLVNKTLAYVALSRPRFEAHVFTDDKERLATSLLRRKENAMALSATQIHVHKRKGMVA